MERYFYLLAYDIAHPKRLTRVARAMEAVGERVQHSVFEAWLTPPELERLLQQVRRILNEEEDSLRVYVLCRGCRARIRTLGIGRVTPPPDTMIV